MGLAPEAFWNMTVLEWQAALAGYGERNGWRVKTAADGLNRAGLLHLMHLYPDVTTAASS